MSELVKLLPKEEMERFRRWVDTNPDLPANMTYLEAYEKYYRPTSRRNGQLSINDFGGD